jgi:hypothetical protein
MPEQHGAAAGIAIVINLWKDRVRRPPHPAFTQTYTISCPNSAPVMVEEVH